MLVIDSKMNKLGGPQEYGRYQQHAALLNDAIRVASYNVAITQTTPRDLVLDIGGGTGILSLLALQHGYRQAILVEPSRKIGRYAKQLLDKHGFSGRYTIISNSFENIPDDFLPDPSQVDLLVTETISSLAIGFGCWPKLLKFAARMRSDAFAIPAAITVFAGYSPERLSIADDGLSRLRSLGIDIDLSERTFWSGGNVHNKQKVRELMKYDLIRAKPIIEIELKKNSEIVFLDAEFQPRANIQTPNSGVVAFFEASLQIGDASSTLASLDDKLISWCPLFVPIPREYLSQIDYKSLSLRTESDDEPYPYSFQFYSGDNPVTRKLLW